MAQFRDEIWFLRVSHHISNAVYPQEKRSGHNAHNLPLNSSVNNAWNHRFPRTSKWRDAQLIKRRENLLHIYLQLFMVHLTVLPESHNGNYLTLI